MRKSDGFSNCGWRAGGTQLFKLLTSQTQNTIIGELVNGCIQFSFRREMGFEVVSNRGAPLWGKVDQ